MKTLLATIVMFLACFCAEAASPSFAAFDTNTMVVIPQSGSNPTGFIGVDTNRFPTTNSLGSLYDSNGAALYQAGLSSNLTYQVGLASTNLSNVASNALRLAVLNGSIPSGLATNISGTLTNNTTGNAATATNTWATTFPAIWALNPAMWVNADAIAGTNGQQITTVPDISGNGANMANATATPVTLLAPGQGIGGHAAINMQANWNPITGANPTVSYGLTNGVWTPGMCTNFSVTFVYQDTLELGGQSPYQVELNSGANPYLWIAGTNQNQYVQNYYSQNSQDMEGVMQFVSGGNSDERPTLPLFKLPMVVTFRQTSGARDTWINGVPVAFTNLDPGTFTSPFSGNSFFVGNWFYRGSINPANGAFCGKISQIILTTYSPSDQQLQSMHQELTSYYNVGGGPLIAFLGDSLTQGTATGPYTNMPGIIKTMIPEATILNEGIGGQASPMLSLLSTNWAGIKINSTGVKIVNIMDFVNDNMQSLTLAAWETNLINTTINFKNNGWIVNWLTIPSFNGESNTPTRLSANTFLYANSNLCSPGKIVDYAADALMGTNGSCAVQPTLYYSGVAPIDVHWLPPGYQHLATNWLYPVLQSELYGGGSGGYAASYSGAFIGNGSGLTNVNASSGSGTFSGNGAGITNISQSSITAPYQAGPLYIEEDVPLTQFSVATGNAPASSGQTPSPYFTQPYLAAFTPPSTLGQYWFSIPQWVTNLVIRAQYQYSGATNLFWTNGVLSQVVPPGSQSVGSKFTTTTFTLNTNGYTYVFFTNSIQSTIGTNVIKNIEVFAHAQTVPTNVANQVSITGVHVWYKGYYDGSNW